MNNKLNKSGQEIVEMMVSQLGKEATIERLAKDFGSATLNGYGPDSGSAWKKASSQRLMLEFLGCDIVGDFYKVHWFVRTDEGKKINIR